MWRVGCTLALIVLGAVLFVGVVVIGPIRGTWRCTVCGAGVDRTRLLGLAYGARPQTTPPDILDWTRRFEGWYAREIGTPHDHDWMPEGCHTGGGTFYCSMDYSTPYFRSLPVCEDQELARTMARAVLAAPKSRRREMLRAFAKSSYLRRPLAPDELSVIFASWPR